MTNQNGYGNWDNGSGMRRGGRDDRGERGQRMQGDGRDNDAWNDDAGAGMGREDAWSTRSRDSFNDDYQRSGEGGRWGYQGGRQGGQQGHQAARSDQQDQYGQGRRYDQEHYGQAGQYDGGRYQESQYGQGRHGHTGMGQPGQYGQGMGQPGQRGQYGQGMGQPGQHGQGMGQHGGEQAMRGGFAGKGPKGYQRSDDRVREQISDALTDEDSLDASDIEVKVEGGEVTLSGTVPSRQCKRTAEDIAERCSGVKDVSNMLRVKRDTDTKDEDKSSNGAKSGASRRDGASSTSAMGGSTRMS